MAKTKYYVVWVGRDSGIFDTWDDCKASVEGYQGAKYKSFKTMDEAKKALTEGFEPHYQIKKDNKHRRVLPSDIISKSICVDAACSKNPGVLEYQGVFTDSSDIYFHVGPLPLGTNNLGEFLAIVHALALQKKEGRQWPIYTDSMTAMSWIKKGRVVSTFPNEGEGKVVWDLIHRAESWLSQHSYKNPILKWDTKNWGEIPADFGRK